jgi:curved DNA-binding protein CbpA
MSNERACLRALRGISARAAAILDRYTHEQAIWVPVAAFQQFLHTLHWGGFEELDLSLLDGLDGDDHGALLEELRAYNAAMQGQRQRVDRFHRAYHQWLDQRHAALPSGYRERLRAWQRRYGLYDYYHITGLGTQSGFERFLTDPEANMQAFEQAFLDLEEQRQRERTRQKQEEADWWASLGDTGEGGPVNTPVEEALRVLGLSRQASFSEIRRAYRVRAKALHPDRQGAEATPQMAALNRAYAYLCSFYRPVAPETRRSEP